MENRKYCNANHRGLCSLTNISIASLLGGPLAGFYLISQNFKIGGDRAKAIKHIICGFVFTLSLLCMMILLPENMSDKIPHYLMPLIYTLLIFLYAAKIQKNLSLGPQSKKYSKLKIIGTIVISLMITFASAIAIFAIFKDKASVAILQKAAEKGDHTAQYNLALLLHEGKTLHKDDREAIKWLFKSANQGDSDAQNNLGVAYHNGEGVEKSDAEAFFWYQKSALQGNPAGQNNLGFAYHLGQGVKQSDTQALRWTQMAAAQGVSQAEFNLALAYHAGQGTEKNDILAIKWLCKAAARQFPDALDLLHKIDQSCKSKKL